MRETGVPQGCAGATFFAPAGRATNKELTQQMRVSVEDPVVRLILDAVDGFVVILNEKRQILAANRAVLDALAPTCPGDLMGLRPGEAFNCIHFSDGPDGCGTSEHCCGCGAVLAILESQESGKPASAACRCIRAANWRRWT